jgi:hypothetical protein
MLRKIVFGGVFVIALIIFGFILLLRSCLSKYDERSVISTPLVIEKNGKTVVLSIVKFDKTTSYSRNGGFVRKSVSSSYYLQNNDGTSGEKLQSKKIKKHSEIKWFPIDILGVSNDTAWLFAGELMAFDPFTLEKLADAASLEIKNPSLKGKLPDQPRYYEFDKSNGTIRITLRDGDQYELNTTTMMAVPSKEKEKDPGKTRKNELEKLLEMIRGMNDSNYSRFRNANKLYSERKLSVKTYKDSSDRFQRERELISKKEDSIRSLVQHVNEEADRIREQQRFAEMLHTSRSFSQLKVNSDSFNKKWYGLFTTSELRNVGLQFEYRKVYGDIDRNQLFSAQITQKDSSDKFSKWFISGEKRQLSNLFYLQGGFLLDIDSGKPIHLSAPDGFLIVSKDQIGNEGKIVLSKVDINGKQSWSVNTKLKEFSYWTIYKRNLYLFGADNNELSSGEINVMHIIDLDNGHIATHDFYSDKNRTK